MSGIIWQRVLEERMPGPADSGPLMAFADPLLEAACVDSGPVMAPLASRTVLRVHGADAQAFLQAQLTADIVAMEVGDSCLAAWCTAKGRVTATLYVLRRRDDWLLVLAADLADFVLARLRLFVLRAKVQMDDIHTEFGVLGCTGELPLAALREKQHAPDGTAISIAAAPTPGDARRRALVVGCPETLAECWDLFAAQGVAAVGETAWDRVLVQAGEPHVTAACREAFIPQMLNLDRLGGISFEKGCYPGQEIVARTKYLGQLKRRMFVGCTSTSQQPVAGTGLYLPDADQAVGQVLLAARGHSADVCDILAVARIDAAQQTIHLASPQGAVTHLQRPPYPLDDD